MAGHHTLIIKSISPCLLAVGRRSMINVSAPVHGGALSYSTKPRDPQPSSHYKLLVVGGGSGGCSVAAKFKNLGRDLAVVEPGDMHYYQPMWTLVGAGLKGFQASCQPMGDCLPTGCDWIKDKVTKFDPKNNSVTLASGEKISYQYLVTALGIQLDFDKIKGLQQALDEDPSVVSNYHEKYVLKTFPALQEFKGGRAIFTFPNTPIKCAGAPQKIMYLADEYFRSAGIRDKTEILFNTSLPVIFGVKKYADALQKVVEKKSLKINYRHALTEIDHKTKTATFAMLEQDNKPVEFKYDMIHVTPPMSAPNVLKSSPLANETGWVDLDKHTLQHTKFSNVFGLGDCTSLPTSKTAAAVAAQCGIVHKNLKAQMSGTSVEPMYDGYTSCPLVTSSKSCILAEFDYDASPLETFPFNQAKERRISYDMKAHIMPELYWKGMLNGLWNGPKFVRQAMHLGMSKSAKMPSKSK